MDKIQKGACAAYHAERPESYYKTIKFWKTPLAQCGNGKSDCVPFQQWVTAWTQITSGSGHQRMASTAITERQARVGPRLGGALAPRLAAGHPHAVTAARLVPGDLPGLAGW